MEDEINVNLILQEKTQVNLKLFTSFIIYFYILSMIIYSVMLLYKHDQNFPLGWFSLLLYSQAVAKWDCPGEDEETVFKSIWK
jgi:hypothetical protein